MTAQDIFALLYNESLGLIFYATAVAVGEFLLWRMRGQ